MSGGDEDDKPTVVLDLNALKKLKMEQEDELADIASHLEFSVDGATSQEETIQKCPVLLFDFQSDFFQKSVTTFPVGYDYKVITTVAELNQLLRSSKMQIAVFNYDVNPKAVNQLCAQIKQKFPQTKTIIMAKSISPQKAKIHAKTPGGASGYYQFPLDQSRLEEEFQKVQNRFQKVG